MSCHPGMVRSSFAESYWQYLETFDIFLDEQAKTTLNQQLSTTNWENPETDLERNAVAVLAILESDRSDPTLRGMYLETAIEVLSGSHHPLCIAHLALIQSLLGNTNAVLSLAYSAFVHTLQATKTDNSPIGIVYLPDEDALEAVLNAKTGAEQVVLMLAEVMQRSQLVFYNATGIRFLTLAMQVLPHSNVLLKLGIAQILTSQWEGLAALHKAQQIKPNELKHFQALFIAYRDLGQLEAANYWLETARQVANSTIDAKWTTLTVESPHTYVSFDQIALAVEASLRSIVTSVLVAAGDWFEQEMEFWRDRIQLGMTVIDVGANVGVYTFSAARQVGSAGKVIAIEPFSGCVRCLEETIRVNSLSQVTVRAGAASNQNGSAKLALQGASELNEVITENIEGVAVEEIECFTLDSLIESEKLDRVDYLKIDAEGHEMQVLMGSDRILAEFNPVILYENIAGTKGSNLPVADYLIAKGYRLFRYQPYVQDLIEINSTDALDGNLNVIALPANSLG